MTPTLRTATASDLRFIHSSWHTSYWKTHARKHLEREVYAPEMDAHIDRVLKDATVLVAFFEAVPDEILGYSIARGDTLHWVYVKGVYRRNGIGSGLVPAEGVAYYSHATDGAGKKFADNIGLKFNPFRSEHP